MSDINTASTDLTSQYAAQVAGDLEANVKEQDRITADIAALQEQLTALQRDHAVLVNVQQALGVASAPAAPESTAPAPEPEATTQAAPEAASESAPAQQSATVPAPRKKAPAKAKAGQRPKKSTAPRGRASTRQNTTKSTATATATASKSPATEPAPAKSTDAKATTSKAATPKATDAKATTTKAEKTTKAQKTEKTEKADNKPTLVELVRGHLSEQKEPRSAAEIATALGQAHPERGIKATVVRTTLEGLVARTQAQRTKQGASVFYTSAESAAGQEPAPAETAQA
jgi:hypothetical protein